MLALSWVWVGWAFHSQRYASINFAAGYFAWAFAAQGLLLVWVGVVRGRLTPAQTSSFKFRAGLGIVFFALALGPMIGSLFGRRWTQAEVFGMAPDPTALATLGVLLLANGRSSYALYPIPVAWCLISGATLWAMEAPDFAIMPAAALLVLSVAVGHAFRRRSA